MKSITIREESCWGPKEEDFSENGFTINYNTGEKEAVIFDLRSDESSKIIPILCEDESSKLIPQNVFEEFWNKLMEINFQKVLLENEPYQGCDGAYFIIEVSVGLQSLTLTLWCPNLEFYKEQNCSESLKLLMIVQKIIDFAASHNVITNFEF